MYRNVSLILTLSRQCKKDTDGEGKKISSKSINENKLKKRDQATSINYIQKFVSCSILQQRHDKVSTLYLFHWAVLLFHSKTEH